jgi:hypothetical protein
MQYRLEEEVLVGMWKEEEEKRRERGGERKNDRE